MKSFFFVHPSIISVIQESCPGLCSGEGQKASTDAGWQNVD